MAAVFILFEAFVIAGWDAVAREDRPQVAQHEVGVHDARFPEVGAAGRGLAAVVVEDHAVADGIGLQSIHVDAVEVVRCWQVNPEVLIHVGDRNRAT